MASNRPDATPSAPPTPPRADELPVPSPPPHAPVGAPDADGLRRAQDGRILPPDVSEEAGEHP